MTKRGFQQGNKDGIRFSANNQPKNNGRKKSRFKQIAESLDIIGETLSKEDYSKIIACLLTLTASELKELAENKETPIAILVVASAISGDIENKQLSNVERLIDRIFGKPVVTQEITGRGIIPFQIDDGTGD